MPWPVPRFTDNGDGTVTDNLTGLIWLKDANCSETVGGIPRDGGLMDWPAALAWCNSLGRGSCGLSDNSAAGDWRLPNINELKSLVDHSRHDPDLPAGHPFSNVQSVWYWSSTSNPVYTAAAFTVGISRGSVYLAGKRPDIFGVQQSHRKGRQHPRGLAGSRRGTSPRAPEARPSGAVRGCFRSFSTPEKGMSMPGRGAAALGAVFALLAVCRPVFAGEAPSAQERWDARYEGNDYLYGKEPADFLRENLARLPKGRALDIAAGEGRNAVFLARSGFDVDAVDISPVGLEKARKLAEEYGVSINTIVADLKSYDLGREKYAVVMNFLYLQRDMIPKIKKALVPGGIVVFETYTVDHRRKGHPDQKIDRQWRLEHGELQQMFQDFKIIVYEEVPNGDVGERATARLLAQKPGREQPGSTAPSAP